MIKKIIMATVIIGITTTAGYINNQGTKHLTAISLKGSSCSRKDDPVNNGTALCGGGSSSSSKN